METYSGNEFHLTSLAPSQDHWGHAPVDKVAEKRLEVFVIFTDGPGTMTALRTAEGLAKQLDAHLRLVLPYEVPYALPLNEPAVTVPFLEGQMRGLAAKTHMEVDAQVCLCRDKRSALSSLLPPHSLIVMAGKKRWWSTPAERLARVIQRDGHHVILAEQRGHCHD